MADANQGAGKLRSAVEDIAARFATASGTPGKQEIRDLAEDLVLDVMLALGKASIAEIAETIDVLERRRANRPAPQATTGRTAAGTRANWIGSSSTSSRDHDSIIPGRRDPFDITMPSELLDQAPSEPPHSQQVAVRRDDDPPASVKRFRRERSERGILAPPSSTSVPQVMVPEEKPAEAGRAPAISLREGEQLLRSSGSGVVIRRARSA